MTLRLWINLCTHLWTGVDDEPVLLWTNPNVPDDRLKCLQWVTRGG